MIIKTELSKLHEKDECILVESYLTEKKHIFTSVLKEEDIPKIDIPESKLIVYLVYKHFEKLYKSYDEIFKDYQEVTEDIKL